MSASASAAHRPFHTWHVVGWAPVFWRVSCVLRVPAMHVRGTPAALHGRMHARTHTSAEVGKGRWMETISCLLKSEKAMRSFAGSTAGDPGRAMPLRERDTTQKRNTQSQSQVLSTHHGTVVSCGLQCHTGGFDHLPLAGLHDGLHLDLGKQRRGRSRGDIVSHTPPPKHHTPGRWLWHSGSGLVLGLFSAGKNSVNFKLQLQRFQLSSHMSPVCAHAHSYFVHYNLFNCLWVCAYVNAYI